MTLVKSIVLIVCCVGVVLSMISFALSAIIGVWATDHDTRVVALKIFVTSLISFVCSGVVGEITYQSLGGDDDDAVQ